tara:strand:+ start:20 stop:415 length:396 start_codon:yes stop_codon:yes gene_type:complete
MNTNLLNKATWSDATIRWKEDDLQLAVAQHLRREGYLFAADQNAGRRSARDGARRKALGMAAGEPDLRVYLDGGRIVFIEMKTARGQLSKNQKQRIKALRQRDHIAHVVKAETPADAVDQVVDIITSIDKI